MTEPQRVSFDVPGLTHGHLPIPSASRVGPLIATGGVRGVDKNSGQLAPQVGDQVDLMLDNLVEIVEAAGGSVRTIFKVTVWAKDPSVREALNVAWLRHFPDPASRPARHFQVVDLAGDMAVQCEALAFAVPLQKEGL